MRIKWNNSDGLYRWMWDCMSFFYSLFTHILCAINKNYYSKAGASIEHRLKSLIYTKFEFVYSSGVDQWRTWYMPSVNNTCDWSTRISV